MTDDIIYTLKKGKIYSAEYREKGSRFLAFAAYCPDEGMANQLLAHFRKNYYDATHVCYAFRIDEQFYRYSDAGEPSGTAGLPIFNAIEHFNLYKVFVAVVRYFGGTKLGKGGLVRAYYESAFRVLREAERTEEIVYATISVQLDYSLLQALLNELSRINGRSDDLEYSEIVRGKILVPKSQAESFKRRMIELSKGQIIFSV